MPFTKKNKFYQDNLIITHQGLCVLQNDYTERDKFAKPVFIFKNLSDLFLFKELIPKDFGDFGAVFCETGGHHKTPVLFQGHNIFVLDSIGTGTTTCGSLRGLEGAFENRFAKTGEHIFISESQRQVDRVSCGSEALLVLKEALRLDMAKFYQENRISEGRIRFLPPSLTKYAQARAFILNNLQQFQHKGKYEISRQSNVFTPEELAVLDGVLIPENIHGGQQSLLAYLDAHPGYSALEHRRNEHVATINAAVDNTMRGQLHQMVARASGLAFLLPGITPDASHQELIEFLVTSDLFSKLQKYFGCLSFADKTREELEQDLALKYISFHNVYHDFINNQVATLTDVLSQVHQVLALIYAIEKPALFISTEMAQIPGSPAGSLRATSSPVPINHASPKSVADIMREDSYAKSPGCSMLFGNGDDW